ncbi:predicted protein [Nematostella vectensis]|uniref:C-CAP/cofactor C-like domain-containing protein n=1 Tax=Nematostella vectensis TaxID=45351 RepID=A7S3Z2_NEMVE|nr:predicted protein [Nematostella vectensis]|eukprot:XP_001633635.1 predicted protein [Nematostella vectensis]
MSQEQANKIQGSFLLASRPKHTISDRDGESIELTSGVPNAMIFVQNCKNCDFSLNQKAVKVFVDSCKNCVFKIRNSLLSGTMELLRCENMTLNLQEDGKVSTLTAEDTKTLAINAERPNQLEMIYVFHTTNAVITVTEASPIHFPITPTEGPDWQYVVQWIQKDGERKLICEKVIREGVFPTTERQLRESLEREREFSQRMATALVDGVKISKPQ